MDKMETVRKIDVTTVKKTSINDLGVCILFCALCGIVVSFASHHLHLYKSVDIDNQVPSHSGAIKNEMAKPDNGRVENGPAGNGGTDVIPFKTTTTQPGQENPSENETPKGLLPP
jgi:hypothetical protein